MCGISPVVYDCKAGVSGAHVDYKRSLMLLLFFFVFNIFLASLSACPWQKCVFRLDFQDKIKYCTMRCCLFGRFIWSHIMCTERETKRFLVLYDLFSIFLVVKADDSERIISAIFSSNLLLLLFVFTSCGIDYLTMEPHSKIQQQ